MHKTRYNALRLTLHLSPRGPLLVKAGGVSADPTLPDMQFVRTFHPQRGETVYIPGSSLKGVVRGFVEKALRTLDRQDSWQWACPTFPDERESCAKKLEKEERSEAVYKRSCGACRIFGHTRLKGRVSFTDLFPVDGIKMEVRYGVAISRLSHAVAHGPFEMEVAVSGTFEGHLVLENFEVWQLGLVALALESMNQGLVKVGFGKNRGFGEVAVQVPEMWLDEVALGANATVWRSLAAFLDEEQAKSYNLFPPKTIADMPQPERTEAAGFYLRRIYGPEGWKEITRRAVQALST
ncbi:MAG: RAMP superfamily CRISPR-associated protein [Thermodesulfobacteriota bacterium]